MALDGGRNAGLLAARFLGAGDDALAQRLDAYAASLRDKVMDSVEDVEDAGNAIAGR